MAKKEEAGKTTENIYQKLQLIQNEIGELVRTEKNKFHNYFFFNELQILKLLKPLLNKYKIVLFLYDDDSKEFTREQVGKMYLVKYGKKCLIINSENPTEQLTFPFWASGQSDDPAKAKGSAETYAAKYFLSKLFLMPVKDESDPDYSPRNNKEEKKEDNLEPKPTISQKQVETLINLYREKTGDNKELKTDFCKELDKAMEKVGIKGTTNNINFKPRISSLNPNDYQSLYDWLEKL